jgi:TonB family protein
MSRDRKSGPETIRNCELEITEADMIYRTAICLLSLTACISLSAAQDTPQTPAQAVHVSAEVAADLLVSKVDPIYPPLARQARIQGVVSLKVIVGNTGDVEDVQLVTGHPMLAPAAIAAVKQWKYRPYLLNGEPIRADIQVQINFTLSNNPPAADVAGDQPAGETADQASDHLGAIVSAAPATTPRIAVPQGVRISSGAAQKLIVRKVNPTYPREARKQDIQGVVLLHVKIDKEGNVVHIELIRGDPMLASAALKAVQRWKYKPYLLNGTPVEVDTQVQINFTLN